MTEVGEQITVWRWAGTQPQEVRALYLGRTESTGEHACLIAGCEQVQILGRGVFDTEAQARWWGMGNMESQRMAADYFLQVAKGERFLP